MSEVIEAGTGATYSVGSDRYPCTVGEVLYFKSGARKGQVRSVGVRRDDVVFNADTKQYSYIPDPHCDLLWFDNKQGRLATGSLRLSIGKRDYYQDPHF